MSKWNSLQWFKGESTFANPLTQSITSTEKNSHDHMKRYRKKYLTKSSTHSQNGVGKLRITGTLPQLDKGYLQKTTATSIVKVKNPKFSH
jgi:hypothetical protein